mmetsp:Transcript_34263/g.51379  ORF Transcript_34263/g.51379 Transcript_34263/m.51379 type:complete len:131 (-) Transcript_34263:332-724(-)|eukprot:scaffold401_cov144-Skeletonema_dohrnii-CCMP3373.AAC.8
MGNTTKNTDEKRKAYKKAKKQRRKLRKAEQLMKQGTGENNTRNEQSSTQNKAWRRVKAEDGAKKAVDRPLEAGYGVDAINELLQRRSAAKAEKNYGVSDEITKTLVRLQIVYDDDRREWHTRAWKYPTGM